MIVVAWGVHISPGGDSMARIGNRYTTTHRQSGDSEAVVGHVGDRAEQIDDDWDLGESEDDSDMRQEALRSERNDERMPKADKNNDDVVEGTGADYTNRKHLFRRDDPRKADDEVLI